MTMIWILWPKKKDNVCMSEKQPKRLCVTQRHGTAEAQIVRLVTLLRGSWLSCPWFWRWLSGCLSAVVLCPQLAVYLNKMETGPFSQAIWQTWDHTEVHRDPFVALSAGLCNHSSLTTPEVGVHTVIKCDELVHTYPFHLFDMICHF